MTREEKIKAILNYLYSHEVESRHEWGDFSVTIYFKGRGAVDLRKWSEGWSLSLRCEELHNEYSVEFKKDEEPMLMLSTRLALLKVIETLDKEDESFIQSLL